PSSWRCPTTAAPSAAESAWPSRSRDRRRPALLPPLSGARSPALCDAPQTESVPAVGYWYLGAGHSRQVRVQQAVWTPRPAGLNQSLVWMQRWPRRLQPSSDADQAVTTLTAHLWQAQPVMSESSRSA